MPMVVTVAKADNAFPIDAQLTTTNLTHNSGNSAGTMILVSAEPQHVAGLFRYPRSILRRWHYRTRCLNMNDGNAWIKGGPKGARKADEPENNSNSQSKPRKCYNTVYVSHSLPPEPLHFKLPVIVGREMTMLRFPWGINLVDLARVFNITLMRIAL
jgi:hypothetical protein